MTITWRQQKAMKRNGRKKKAGSKSPWRLPLVDRTGRFLLYVNMMLSIENAALERLHARIQQCPIPEARSMLIHHLEETREQRGRLEAIIRRMGGGQQSFLAVPTNERAALPQYAPPKMLADALEQSSSPIERELKTMEADWLIDNAEAMGYKTLIQMAHKMGFGEAMVALRQNLEEEGQMAAWIRANSPAIFGQYWGQMETEWKVA